MRYIKEIMIVAVCLMVLSFCVCTGFGIYFMYREGVQEYEDLRTYVKETDEMTTQKEQTKRWETDRG
ncbi:MAG: hypothetical protein ACLVB1_01325 [Blautia obeum]